jgi:hypothetical protein
MNTKTSKLVSILIVLIVVVTAVVIFTTNQSSDVELSNKDRVGGITLESLLKAKVHVPELNVDVDLVSGQGEFPVLDTPVIGYVAIGKNIATSSSLAISTLAVNGGGTGIFEYLALFRESSNGSIEHTSSIFIGDRIEVKSIEFTKDNSGKVTGAKVSYLDRSPDDAMAEIPTIPRTLEVLIKDSKFVE